MDSVGWARQRELEWVKELGIFFFFGGGEI